MSILQLDVRLSPEAAIPTRANPTDAGLDLAALHTTKLDPFSRTLVDTGVSVRIPAGYVGLVAPRSSLSKRGIFLTNSVGIIDADYRGTIMLSLMVIKEPTFYQADVIVNAGERLAQLILLPISLPTVNLVFEADEVWTNTTRSTGGFGSSGM